MKNIDYLLAEKAFPSQDRVRKVGRFTSSTFRNLNKLRLAKSLQAHVEGIHSQERGLRFVRIISV